MPVLPLPFDPLDLSALLLQFFLPFFRLAAFFMAAPIFADNFVPTRVRLLLSLAVAMVLFPVLPPLPAIDPFSLSLFVVVAEQLFIGFALGFFAQLFFHIFIMAGHMVAMQMGLGFSSMVDPSNGVSVVVVSQIYVLLVALLFLAFDGHLVLIEVMVEGFSLLPIAATPFDQGVSRTLVLAAGWMMASALLLALPAVAAILIVNFAFGVMTRSAPQLNIFSLGFPFTLLFGLFILWASLAGFLPQYRDLSEQAFRSLRLLLAA